MADWDLLLTDARIATMQPGSVAYGRIDDGALAIRRGRIDWLGALADLPLKQAAETRSLAGRWLTPALIDCHTHLVFAGNRASEFEARLKGASYQEIAAAGGGIRSTVRSTRAASAEMLLRESTRRVLTMKREGVATVEIKSGYGLDLETEEKMLAVAGELGRQAGMTVRRTYLGAHATPPDFAGSNPDYIEFLVNDGLPRVHERGLVDAVDAYCEGIAFSADELTPLFERAAELGVPVKLHADQLSDCAGAELAAAFGALSADHLEYTSERGVRALADAGSVAVLLPGAFLTLKETQVPPVDALREHGVPIAIASDCNPGTSPIPSVRIMMSLAATLFRLTPEECLAGATREAARALGLYDDRGTLEAGKRADLAVWDIEHPAELSYWLGLNPLADLYIAGEPQRDGMSVTDAATIA
jgi:imidazolonepropionase